MVTTRRAGGLTAAIVLLACATACSSDRPAPRPEPGTASPSPTQASREQVAATDATKLLHKYYAVRDELRQKPDSPLTELQAVAISIELDAQQKLFKDERARGLRQTGDTEIAELTVQSIDLDNSDPKAGRVPTVQIDACFDVSDVDILDRNGKSVVGSNRPDTGWIRYTVANYEWSKNPTGGWRVASSRNLGRTPCGGS